MCLYNVFARWTVKTGKFTLLVNCNFLVLLSTTVCSQNINKQIVNIADETLTDYSFLSRYHYTKSQNYLKKTISNSSLNTHVYWDTLYSRIILWDSSNMFLLHLFTNLHSQFVWTFFLWEKSRIRKAWSIIQIYNQRW